MEGIPGMPWTCLECPGIPGIPWARHLDPWDAPGPPGHTPGTILGPRGTSLRPPRDAPGSPQARP